MKTKLIELLRYLLSLLENQDGPGPINFAPHIWELAKFAKELCDRQDATTANGTSGEYKRDRVFEQMINTFPARKPWDIYMAILLARRYIRGDQ